MTTSPTNNNFSAATVVTGSHTSFAVSLQLATAEPYEPAHGGIPAVRSVWFRWVAPAHGAVQITLHSYSFMFPVGAMIGVYRGAHLQDLQAVTLTTLTNGVGFTAFEGTTYHIAVDDPNNSADRHFTAQLLLQGLNLTAPADRTCILGETIMLAAEPPSSEWSLSRLEFFAGTNLIGIANSAPWQIHWKPETNGVVTITAMGQTTDGGTLDLRPLTFRVRPPNDDFHNAVELPPLIPSAMFAFNLAGATLETGETNFSAPTTSASLWWKWTPSLTTKSTMFANGMRLTAYQGDHLTNLTQIAQAVSSFRVVAWGAVSHNEPAMFTNYAGQTYWFSIQSTSDSDWSWSLSQRLHWLERETPQPAVYARQPVPFRIAQAGGINGPASVTVQVKPTGTGTNWMLISHLTNAPSFQWTWFPELPIDYDVKAFGVYPSGEPWTSTVQVPVLVANDLREFATVIPGMTASLPFRTDRANVDEYEPNLPTNIFSGTVWWQWQPESSARVRLHASGTWGGLPVDIFTEDHGSLTRVAHNEGRTTMPPLQGFAYLEADASKVYWIRVADTLRHEHLAQLYPPISVRTVRTNYTLVLEGADAPLRSLAILGTILGTPQPNGEIQWQSYARALTADGAPATNVHYRAQFYGGATLGDVRPLGSPVMVWNPTPGVSPGAVGGGLANIPGVQAGENFWIQLRAWDGNSGATYEAARASGGYFGRNPFVQVTAGSESTGPTTFTNLADVVIGSKVSPFRAGELRIAESTNGRPRFELVSSRGFLHSIEASSDGQTWTPLLLLTNGTGTIQFAEPRINPPAFSLFKTRVID